MIRNPFARPDITLTLDKVGVIRDAVPSGELAEEGLDAWRGRPWSEVLDIKANGDVPKLIADMRKSGASSCFTANQVLPSGRELPFEFTTISLGKEAGFVAIGRSLQAVAELQSRVKSAQEEREKDYWKFRELETHYKMFFDASSDATVVVRVSNLRIVEANVAATKALGLLPGPELFPTMPSTDRKAFESLLEKVRNHGRAPAIALRLTEAKDLWSLRASLMTTESGAFYLFQMTPFGAAALAPPIAHPASVESFIKRLPDGFIIVDREGVVQFANDTFLDLTQTGVEAAVTGQNLKRWLSQPGADLTVLLSLLERHGSVRLMTTMLSGELGSNTPVEISAVGDKIAQPEFFGLVIRDTTIRPQESAGAPDEGASIVAALSEGLSLGELVKASKSEIEQKNILAMLELCHGNKAATAKRLGFSRQSLHSKLKRYHLNEK